MDECTKVAEFGIGKLAQVLIRYAMLQGTNQMWDLLRLAKSGFLSLLFLRLYGSRSCSFKTIWFWYAFYPSPFLRRFPDPLVKASGLPLDFPSQYVILKLNKTKIQTFLLAFDLTTSLTSNIPGFCSQIILALHVRKILILRTILWSNKRIPVYMLTSLSSMVPLNWWDWSRWEAQFNSVSYYLLQPCLALTTPCPLPSHLPVTVAFHQTLIPLLLESHSPSGHEQICATFSSVFLPDSREGG